jgi:hypothetical protein
MSHGYLGVPAHTGFMLRVGIGFTAIMRMLGVNTLNQHRMAIEFLDQDLDAADRTRADLESAGLI